MKPVPIALTTFGSALLLAVVPAAGAQAATGTFRYVNAYSKLPVTVTNPADATCIATTAFGAVTNSTNRDATLYPSPACQGEPLGTLAPNGTANNLSFASIMLTPTPGPPS
ncbi:hypothetical protein [Streptomyces sp. NPDC058434]|uniref:hypothetical protein n=1 Tax=Streptomyces sp. NPDC058434 TaxID=3346498 RepID=UPI00365C801F